MMIDIYFIKLVISSLSRYLLSLLEISLLSRHCGTSWSK